MPLSGGSRRIRSSHGLSGIRCCTVDDQNLSTREHRITVERQTALNRNRNHPSKLNALDLHFIYIVEYIDINPRIVLLDFLDQAWQRFSSISIFDGNTGDQIADGDHEKESVNR